MENCYLDANVLVYYKNEESPFFEEAAELMQQLVEQNSRLFVSPLVLDEFLFQIKILLDNKEVRMEELFNLLKRALEEILSLPNLVIINPPSSKEKQLKVISSMKEFNLRPRDAYHLLTMLENNIRFFATFDNDFEAVFKEKVLLPVRPSRE